MPPEVDSPHLDIPIEERKFTLAEISKLAGIRPEVLLNLVTQPSHHNTRLSRRQRKILEFITTEIDSNGYSPTIREIGVALGGISPATVHEHLQALTQKGYILRSAPRATGLTVLRPITKRK